MFFILGALLILGIIGLVLYRTMPEIGRAPDPARIKPYESLSYFKDGQFQNQEFTPSLSEGHSMPGVLWEFLFNRTPGKKPVNPLPSVKVNPDTLQEQEDWLIWFGHSGYFLQVENLRMLVDPVFSGNAAPLPGLNRAFPGTDRYQTSDFRQLDYLLITHDHYDHLDYQTIFGLHQKTRTIICGAGVGAHLEFWGVPKSKIREVVWGDSVELSSGCQLRVEPARHFSGRGFSRNNTLWVSYLLQTPKRSIYIGGDSGYGSHFSEICFKYGPVDLAILDNGQYNEAWREIHMHPEDVLQASRDLKVTTLFPVHSGKFVMANHPWQEPLNRIAALVEGTNIRLMTPLIGEAVNLNDENRTFVPWWVNLK